MKDNFKEWLVCEYGLKESAAASRAGNISRIERYYGDIDVLIGNGNVSNLLQSLSYTTDDERNNRPQQHKVPICGNVRKGSATLKQALSRYIEFREATAGIPCQTKLQSILSRLKAVLGQFKPAEIQDSYADKKDVQRLIQNPLLEMLRSRMPEIEWEKEVKLNSKVKDSVDILGVIDGESLVVIEIDTHRTDQICKKFVSRQALTDDKSTIYVVVTYPNTNSQSQPEKVAVEKYARYMTVLTNIQAQGTNLEKYFYIRSL